MNVCPCLRTSRPSGGDAAISFLNLERVATADYLYDQFNKYFTALIKTIKPGKESIRLPRRKEMRLKDFDNTVNDTLFSFVTNFSSYDLTTPIDGNWLRAYGIRPFSSCSCAVLNKNWRVAVPVGRVDHLSWGYSLFFMFTTDSGNKAVGVPDPLFTIDVDAPSRDKITVDHDITDLFYKELHIPLLSYMAQQLNV